MPHWLELVTRRAVLWNRRRLYRRLQARMPRYETWIGQFDTIGADERSALLQRLRELPAQPSVTLLLQAGAAPVERQQALVNSVREQLYPGWALLVVPGAGSEAAHWWSAQASSDARIRVLDRETDQGGLLRAVQSDWLAWADANEQWPLHALLLLVEAALHRPDTVLVYGDEDRLDHGGRRSDPQFKPDWDPDLLLSHDFIGRPALWRASWLRQHMAPPADRNEASWRHDFVLRATHGVDAQGVLHVPQVLCHVHADAATRQRASLAGVRAQLARSREAASCEKQVDVDGVRVRFALPDPAPTVAIVIPTRNGLRLLRNCVDSILLRTQYANYRIVIVDNGSDDPGCVAWLREVAVREDRVVVRRDDSPFNFAALNNRAIAEVDSEFVALVNNDIEVISPDWLTEMVTLAARPGVGAVGARLWYSDGSLQHGGVVIGIGDGAGHAHKRLRRTDPGMMGRAHRLQSFSAVTAACLVLRRSVYQAVGGMDADHFAVAFNDVDLCLRVRALGLRNLWTPFAELYHHESVTRGVDHRPEKKARFLRERAVLQTRWPSVLAHDPAYNPNLTLANENFALAMPPRVSLLKPWFEARPDDHPTP